MGDDIATFHMISLDVIVTCDGDILYAVCPARSQMSPPAG
jgi:hypothetical protein